MKRIMVYGFSEFRVDIMAEFETLPAAVNFANALMQAVGLRSIQIEDGQRNRLTEYEYRPNVGWRKGPGQDQPIDEALAMLA